MTETDITSDISPDLSAALEQFIATRAPADWTTATVTCHGIGDFIEDTTVYETADGTEREFTNYPHWRGTPFDTLREACFCPDEGTWFTAELTIGRDGEISATADYEREPPWSTPLVPGLCISEQQRFPRDTAAFPDWYRSKLVEADTRTDAHVPDTIPDLLDAIQQAWAAVVGPDPLALNPPADPARVDELEALIGEPLPADVRTLYEIADGQAKRGGDYLFFGHRWNPLDEVIQSHTGDTRADYEEVFSKYPIPRGSTPAEIREVEWSPGWVPLGDNRASNYLYIDLDPAPAGQTGQVIRTKPGTRIPYLWFPSVTGLLQSVLRALQNHDYYLAYRSAAREQFGLRFSPDRTAP